MGSASATKNSMKYQSLARDAHASGDRIAAENYQQHAEHYFRILSAAQNASAQATANGAAKNANGSEGGEEVEEKPASNGRQRGRRPKGGDQAAAKNGSGGDKEETVAEATEVDGADASDADAKEPATA